jgi:hypothetical protein
MFEPFKAERLAPDPAKTVLAVIVVPVIAAAVELPIKVPLIAPPVIDTLLAFCSAIVPKPVTAELGIVVLAVTGLELLPYRKPVSWLITTFAEAVRVPDALRLVNAPVFAVTPPIVGGALRKFAKPTPLTSPEADRVVNAPLLGVALPIRVPLIEPPVIETVVAFCSAMVPRPVTEELGMTIAVLTALVS